MKLAIIIGNFQPLHNGHVTLINKAVEDNDRVLILIAGINKLPNYVRPFSFQDRKVLMEKVIQSNKLDIRGLPDSPTKEEWVSNVIAHQCSIEEDPTHVTLYTSEKERDFYSEALLYTVETVDELPINSVDIRNLFYAASSDLKILSSLVPKDTLSFLGDIEVGELWRLSQEKTKCEELSLSKRQEHSHNNSIEPVAHAIIVQNQKVLTVIRKSVRGYGQRALVGGYIDYKEESMGAAMREALEETGVDLIDLSKQGKCKCLVRSIEENLSDIGSRTLGINYLFIIKEDLELKIVPCPKETLGYEWVVLDDILREKELLFFNHNLVVQRVYSMLSSNATTKK